jgi:hypothetical protein
MEICHGDLSRSCDGHDQGGVDEKGRNVFWFMPGAYNYIYIYVITHFGSRLKHECVRRNSSSYCALLLDELVRGIAQEQCDIELASVNK